MEKIDVQELAKRLEMSVEGVRGWLKNDLLVWHTKDAKTGVKNEFYWPCVEVRWYFIKTMRDNRKKNAEIAKYFIEGFGKKDEHLLRVINDHEGKKTAIPYFEKLFTKKGAL